MNRKIRYKCPFCNEERHGKRYVKKDSDIKLVYHQTNQGIINLPKCVIGKKVKIIVQELGPNHILDVRKKVIKNE